MCSIHFPWLAPTPRAWKEVPGLRMPSKLRRFGAKRRHSCRRPGKFATAHKFFRRGKLACQCQSACGQLVGMSGRLARPFRLLPL
jgi:hypothetical protein